MVNSAQEALITRVGSEVFRRMSGQGAGHDVDHVKRVLATAQEIQAAVGGDLLIITLAALLHDVGDAKFHAGVERSAEFARAILRESQTNDCQLTPAQVEHVVHIVDNLSFRKTAVAESLTLEGQIVQDADRLDALGAIGIVRTIEYGAVLGQPFYTPEDIYEWRKTGATQGKSGLAHFYTKLFKLKELMNTEPARKQAVRKEKFMLEFIEQFCQEVEPRDQ